MWITFQVLAGVGWLFTTAFASESWTWQLAAPVVGAAAILIHSRLLGRLASLAAEHRPTKRKPAADRELKNLARQATVSDPWAPQPRPQPKKSPPKSPEPEPEEEEDERHVKGPYDVLDDQARLLDVLGSEPP